MDEIIHVINNVGFPIVACIFMFQQNMKLTSAITDLNNTLAKIDNRIEQLEKEVL